MKKALFKLFLQVRSERVNINKNNMFIELQYEKLEAYFLDRIKPSFINEDEMFVWEVGNISPRL